MKFTRTGNWKRCGARFQSYQRLRPNSCPAVKNGRPPKGATEYERWMAEWGARNFRNGKEAREALFRLAYKGNWKQADWKRPERLFYTAAAMFFDLSGGNPAKFLRLVADALDGKLKISASDKLIWDAVEYLRLKQKPVTERSIKARIGRNPLASNFALKRAIARLGIPLDE